MAHKRDLLKVLVRATLLFVCSNAAVLGVIQFGALLWPEGLPVNTQNIFWLASGVNAAGLLLLGRKYWPVLLLNAFPAWLIASQPLELCLIGALANVLEALLASWIIQRPGDYQGDFERLRPVGALVVASLLAPLANTLLIPTYLCLRGVFPWQDLGKALGNWNLSNGTAILILTPLLLVVASRPWQQRKLSVEGGAIAVLTAVMSLFAFDEVFEKTGVNYAFLIFPVIIYAAVRFGLTETVLSLGAMLLALYTALAWHAGSLPVENVSQMIWFVQAFCWVLAATSLLICALASERRRAEQETLEASLSAERARLAALRYQINPHFLFNALNSVRAVLPLSEERARAMITDLSSYLRTTLDTGEQQMSLLRDEIGSVNSYLAVERQRFSDRLQVEVAVDDAVADVEVPTLLLQPLVENAIRHGLEQSLEPFQLRISANRHDGLLRLEIANTGGWRAPVADRPGLGLDNIRRRLHLIYHADASLRIAEEDGWVRLTVELPC